MNKKYRNIQVIIIVMYFPLLSQFKHWWVCESIKHSSRNHYSFIICGTEIHLSLNGQLLSMTH